jgi:CheY-like chemotaxis protein
MPRERPLIAVIDDDRVYLAMMGELLADEGYQAVCCEKGHEAQCLIRTAQPDVVILDIRLEHPESGLTILELLRLVPATKDIPVIVCSADTPFLRTNEARLRQYQCAILEKPFDVDELFEIISGFIDSSQPWYQVNAYHPKA